MTGINFLKLCRLITVGLSFLEWFNQKGVRGEKLDGMVYETKISQASLHPLKKKKKQTGEPFSP